MREIKLSFEDKTGPADRDIERACASLGLMRTMRTSLKTLPANTHWHYKRGKENGVMEITLLHDTGSVTISYADGRYAQWIDKAIDALKIVLQKPTTA